MERLLVDKSERRKESEDQDIVSGVVLFSEVRCIPIAIREARSGKGARNENM